MPLEAQSTYRGRVEIGGVSLPLSWSVQHNFVRDGRYSERSTPHPHQAGLIFPSWWNIRQKSGHCHSVFSVFKKGTQSGELSDFFGPTTGLYTPKGKILTNVSIFSDFAHIFQFLPYPRGLDICICGQVLGQHVFGWGVVDISPIVINDIRRGRIVLSEFWMKTAEKARWDLANTLRKMERKTCGRIIIDDNCSLYFLILWVWLWAKTWP